MQVRRVSTPGTTAARRETVTPLPDRRIIITALGTTQIFAWGTSYYLPAVLAKPMADDTGWSLAWVIGGLSAGLLAAGLASPRVGRTIQRIGGRPVLAASAVLLGVGLLGLGLAHSLVAYLFAWCVIGLGMGAGLYDAAFATLGRLYGQGARSAIGTLTLFGGFASTACWPLSAFLESQLGWRGACLVYAAYHLAVALPIYLLVLPREAVRTLRQADAPSNSANMPPPTRPARSEATVFAMAATAITLSAMISTLMSVHLLVILQSRGIALAAAVALGALVGPCQVGARVIELLIARYHHPIWTKLASTVLVALGISSLLAGLPAVSAALVLYGAGIGIESIARGTLPLAVFGETRYAAIMGRIAMPSLIAQAAAPSLGAWLMGSHGPVGTLSALVVAAVANVLLVATLFACLRLRRPALC
jgi:predicted MFS family arabinose efflux permease